MSLATTGEAASVLGFQVFRGCDGWTALDELNLLDGIKVYGFGNWKDAAAHVGKPLLECKQHYEDVYLASSSAPLPQPGRALEAPVAVPARPLEPVATPEAAGAAGATGTSRLAGPRHGPDDDSLAISATAARARSRSKSKGRPKGKASGPSVVDPDVSGFMPLRGDFDVEWDNDAELMLADMEFRDGEHPTETELKLKVVEIYNAKLDERERRKRFVLERGLLDFKARLAEERRRPREEREIRNMLRPFARFHSHADHEALVAALMEEHRLRRRIAQLQHWRRQGVRTLAEGEEYEAAKQQRATESRARRQRSTAPHLYPPASSSARAGRRRDRTAARAEDAADGPPLAPVPAPLAAEAAAPAAGAAAGVSGEPRAKRARATATAPTSAAGPLATGVSASATAPEAGAAPSDVQSLADAPGAAGLSPRELSLCEHMRLLPSQYAAIRAAVVEAGGADGARDRGAQAGAAEGASAAQSAAVFDLCVSCGWVSAEPGGGDVRP